MRRQNKKHVAKAGMAVTWGYLKASDAAVGRAVAAAVQVRTQMPHVATFEAVTAKAVEGTMSRRCDVGRIAA